MGRWLNFHNSISNSGDNLAAGAQQRSTGCSEMSSWLDIFLVGKGSLFIPSSYQPAQQSQFIFSYVFWGYLVYPV